MRLKAIAKSSRPHNWLHEYMRRLACLLLHTISRSYLAGWRKISSFARIVVVQCGRRCRTVPTNMEGEKHILTDNSWNSFKMVGFAGIHFEYILIWSGEVMSAFKICRRFPRWKLKCCCILFVTTRKFRIEVSQNGVLVRHSSSIHFFWNAAIYPFHKFSIYTIEVAW